MSTRIDTASRLIGAPAARIYRAFATSDSMEAWLPPRGMTGQILDFAFCEGGGYRMRLTYDEPGHVPGKTSEDGDEVEVKFVRLVQEERLEQAVAFDSDDPAFSGEMRMTWVLEPMEGGTLVTVRCEDVPVGIRPEDHEVGLRSTLGNLATFAERGGSTTPHLTR